MRRCEWCDKEFGGKYRHARFCSENCRKRACEEAHRGACPECGGAMQVGSAWASHAPKRCRTCHDADQQRETWRRRRMIQLMWEDRASIGAISDAIGIAVSGVKQEMHRMRDDGWDLPYRYDYTAEGIERIREAARRTRAEEKARRQAA